MKPSDDLFHLIASLNRLERGYFSKYSEIHVKGEENKYKKLFQVLCSMNSFSDEKLKKRLQGEDVLNYLSTAKNQLYQTILKTMRPYNDEVNIDTKLNDILSDIDLVMAKGLYKQARKLINRLNYLCQQQEKHHIWQSSLRRELQLVVREGYHVTELIEKIQLIQKNQEIAFKKLDNLLTIEGVYYSLLAFSKEIGVVKCEQEKQNLYSILDNPILSAENNCWSKEAKIYFNLIFAEKAKLINDSINEDKHLSKVFVLIIGKQPYSGIFPILYLQSLLMKAKVLLKLGKFKDFVNILMRIKRLNAQVAFFKQDNFKSQIFYETGILELQYLIATSEFKKAVEQVSFFEMEMKEYEERCSAELKQRFFLQCSMVYFLYEDVKSAWVWLQKVANEDYSNHDSCLINFIKIYYLLIHMELGNKDHLFYAYRSTLRRFEKYGHINSFDKIWLNYFKVNVYRGKRISNIYPHEKIYNELVEFKKTEFGYLTEQYLNVVLWAESKSKNKSMHRLAIEKYKQGYESTIAYNVLNETPPNYN